MRRFLLSVLISNLTTVATVLPFSPALAANPGSLQLSWSGTEFPGTVPTLQPTVPFDLWVVALDPADGIEAYEFTLDLAPSGCWTILEETLFPASAYDFGSDPGASTRNYIVGTGAVCLEGATVGLVRLRVRTEDAACFGTGIASLRPSTPTSFDPAQPGYLACDSPGDLRTFEVGPDLRFRDLPGTPNPPLIQSFTSDASELLAGDTATLSWDVLDADTLVLEPGSLSLSPVSGSIGVQPSETTTYVLTATNTDGTMTAELQVDVVPFVIQSFNATPQTVEEVQDVLLQWEVLGSAFVSIDGFGPQAQSGNLIVRPTQTTTYTLQATHGGLTRSVSTQVTFQNTDPGSLQFSWSGTQLDGPAPVLEPMVPFDLWVVTPDPPGQISDYEFSVELTPADCFEVLEEIVFPPGATDLGVDPLPSLRNFVVDVAGACVSEPVVSLARMQLRATSSTCLMEGVASLAGSTPSRFSGAPGYFDCSDNPHAFQPGADVLFNDFRNPRPPAILDFRADPTQLVHGQTATLTWSVNEADSIQIEPGGFSSADPAGTWTVQPTETTTYVLTATNVDGSATAEVTIEVTPFVIASFTATPEVITPPEASLLEWHVLGDASVSIEGYGSVPLSSSLIVRPTSVTTYTLTATGQGMTRTATVTVRIDSPEPGLLAMSWSSTSFPGNRPSLEPGVPFEVWVLAIDLPAGVEAYEFSVQLLPEECYTVLEEETFPQGSTDFGVDPSPSIRNYLVGTGGTCHEDYLLPLVRLKLVTSRESCLTGVGGAVLAPATPSSFDPASAGYLACDSPGDIRPFPFVTEFFEIAESPTTPAVAIQLSAVAGVAGIELDWDAPGADAWDHLQILRRDAADSDAYEQSVLDLRGPEAAGGTYLDTTVLAGVTYSYRARLRSGGIWIESEPVVAKIENTAPARTRLLGNSPNPFNPRTEIRFTLAQRAAATLEIFDSAGRRVRRVELGSRQEGEHSWTWRGEDDNGREVSSGVYHARLTAGRRQDVATMALVR